MFNYSKIVTAFQREVHGIASVQASKVYYSLSLLTSLPFYRHFNLMSNLLYDKNGLLVHFISHSLIIIY